MTAQFGPHRWEQGDDGHNLDLQGARYQVCDLRAARFTDCDLSGVKIVDSSLVNVDVSGWIDGFVVNGIDVTAYVSDELDKRHPERVQLREIADADGFRAMWETVESLWADTTARALRLPAAALHQRVDEEWSYAETLRHLVFITDAWASRTILDEENPFHGDGLPQSAYPRALALDLGIGQGPPPAFEEVLTARSDRMAVVRRIVGELTNADLGRTCDRAPAPGYPDAPRVVAECLAVLMEEEIAHHHYATRDLALLEVQG